MAPSTPISIGALTITFLLEASDTGGVLTQFELTVPPAARVPAPHSHDAFEEALLGVDGTLTWTVGGQTHEVGPGDAIFIPRGVVHGFENRGAETVRAIATIAPGVLGPAYFSELGALLGTGPPDPGAVGEVMRRHGLTPA